TSDLAGKSLDVAFADGGALKLAFSTAELLSWNAGARGHDRQSYQAFRVRDGMYFVDFIDAGDEMRSISLWLDLTRNAVLLIEGSVADRAAEDMNLLTRVEKTGAQSVPTLTYRAGGIGRPIPDFPRTEKLFGKFFRYEYSDTHVYDHYYVNPKYYFWYCWRGPDAGIGEFDEADYFELADDIYLICWREKFLPCLAVTIEDLGSMRSIGKVFGADSHTWRTGNSTVGATMSVIATIPPGAVGSPQ
ncbi:molybdenum cofactor biosynthesis protein F, partial [Mesorhizobium sp. M4A.F.Ca.ET.020.02.1.1]